MIAAVNLITQMALGALMGDLLLGRRLGRMAMAWGALISCLPALEDLLGRFLHTSTRLTSHHGPSHSLLTITLASAALGTGLAKLWRRQKITRTQASLFTFTLLSGHALLECLTVDGAALLWPFSPSRITLNLLPQPDFLFASVLVIPALWLATRPAPLPPQKSRRKTPPPPPRRNRIRNIALVTASSLVLLCFSLKWLATAGFDHDLIRRNASSSRRIVGPAPCTFLLWRAVVDRGDALWVGYRSVFDAFSTPVRWTAYPRQPETLAGWANGPEFEALNLTTDGWWIARPHTKGAWIGDLRRPEARIWDQKPGMVDSRAARSWVFSADGQDRLRQVDTPWHTPGTLSRMTARIFGNHPKWEANPRLAGVTGRFPEFLPSQD